MSISFLAASSAAASFFGASFFGARSLAAPSSRSCAHANRDGRMQQPARLVALAKRVVGRDHRTGALEALARHSTL